MKICVFQSSFAKLQSTIGNDASSQLSMNPSRYISPSNHTITHKTIHKETAISQINEAVAENHDFYLNFLWGTHDDDLAGVEAIKYLEALDLPMAGIASVQREQSKYDFFKLARRNGGPLVPAFLDDDDTHDEEGGGRGCGFPVFVKPACGYGSMFIDGRSLCRDEGELEECLVRLQESMREIRYARAVSMGIDAEGYVRGCEEAGRKSTDLVIQEFIQGEEYSVVVIAMGEVGVPLIPQRVKYKTAGEEGFLTLDLKFDAESGYELLDEAEDAELYRYLQAVAVETFHANKMHVNNMGCDVDMRIGSDGRAYVIEVDPLPVFFYPAGSKLEDTDVQKGFPGSYRGVVNTYITNYFLKHPEMREERLRAMEERWDGLAERYSAEVEWFDVEGRILDLACGGRQLKQSSITGVDISKRMLQRCRGYIELVHEDMVTYLSRQTESFDHIFCISGLQFVSNEEVDFILARCFQLARQSITFTVSDKEKENIISFGVPFGWKCTYNNGVFRYDRL